MRLGHFPNVTHAHGLVAHALSRRGEGVFEKHLGENVRVEWYVFNAGPTAMESLLAGSLDATYVGPNPALNAHIRTGGDDVRVLAGATNGGSALVVRKGLGIKGPEDFRGRKIATPQFANTQDISCRAWLTEHGLSVTQTGGDAMVIPTRNPDQLALFQKGDLDAVWTVEPWISRLELEAGGEILLLEEDAVTTLLAASAALLSKRPEIARKLLAAHRELTAWILSHPAEARELVRSEIQAVTGRPIAAELVERCWPRLKITDEIRLDGFLEFAERARAAGFLDGSPDLSRLIHKP